MPAIIPPKHNNPADIAIPSVTNGQIRSRISIITV